MNYKAVLFAFASAALVPATFAPASAAGFFNIQVSAVTLATVTLTVNAAGGLRATGSIRSHKSGTGSLIIRAPQGAGPARITCLEESAAGTHGPAELASLTAPSDGSVICASWAGPNIFAYVVDIVLDVQSVAPGDSATLAGWSVLATAT